MHMQTQFSGAVFCVVTICHEYYPTLIC